MKLRHAVLSLILLLVLWSSALAQSATPSSRNFVFLPLTQRNYISVCNFHGNPIWLDVWLSVNTPMQGDNILGLFNGVPGVDGTLINLYHDVGDNWLGQTDSLQYPLYVFEFDAQSKPENRTYVLRCSLISQPQPPNK